MLNMKKYTIWENTPLNWHIFLTYIKLPLTVLGNISLLIFYADNINSWAWEITGNPLGWIDICCAVATIILSTVAFLGCLPKRRKWYGPQCVIALYIITALYSLYLNVLGGFIANSIMTVLVSIYYCKRRPLFSSRKSLTIEEEPENSLTLLQKIQEEAERERSAPVNDMKPSKKHRILIIAVAVLLVLIAGIQVMGTVIENSAAEAYEEGYDDGYYEGYTKGLARGRRLGGRTTTPALTQDTVTVYVTRTGEKYHRSSCPNLGQSKMAISLEEAIDDGYTPCSRCDPPEP